MQDTIAHFDTTKHWAMLPFFMASAAELRGDIGDIGNAVALLERASELANAIGEEWCAAEILRLRARFCARDAADELALLQASLSKAAAQGARFWQLRTAVSLAEYWRKQGKRDAARDVLAPVYAGFTEGLDSPDLISARTLLDELGRS